VIERMREVVAPDGTRSTQRDVVRLDRLEPEQLAHEAAELGYQPLPPRAIEPTDEHVGSRVVLLRVGAAPPPDGVAPGASVSR